MFYSALISLTAAICSAVLGYCVLSNPVAVVAAQDAYLVATALFAAIALGAIVDPETLRDLLPGREAPMPVSVPVPARTAEARPAMRAGR